MRDLSSHLDRNISNMRKIMLSYENVSYGNVLHLQSVVRNLSNAYVILRAKSYSDSIDTRTQYLSLQIRLYSTHGLFTDKVHALRNSAKKLKVPGQAPVWGTENEEQMPVSSSVPTFLGIRPFESNHQWIDAH